MWALLCRQPTPGCAGAWAGAGAAPSACPGSVSVCEQDTGPAPSSATGAAPPSSLLPPSPLPSEGLPQDTMSRGVPSLSVPVCTQTQECCASLFETHSLLREHQTKPDKGSVCAVTPSQRGRSTKAQDI